MIKAALFDLDGVIFDTEPQYTLFWGSVFRSYYPDQPGLEQAIKGQTLTQIYDRFFSGSLASEQPAITRRLNAYERTMTFPYVAGFREFADSLRAAGVCTAVVTSSNNQKMARVYEQHLDFPSLFDAILTSEDFQRSKPAPDCYLEAMARFNASPRETVVFEDSINGLQSGRDSGAFVVALATSHTTDTLRPLSHYQIPDFTSLDINRLNALL